jgi:hypothetical protein
MMERLERILKEAVHGFIKALSWHMPGGPEENNYKPQSRELMSIKMINR